MTPIERITGFACKVDQSQWAELVRVADEVGLPVGDYVRSLPSKCDTLNNYAAIGYTGHYLSVFSEITTQFEIPFPDFLSKLKGEEETWVPKNGEEV